MDLIAGLRRFGFARPHLLVVQAAGGTPARLAVERWSREHGWPVAASPADADVVLVCGAVSPTLEPLVGRVVDSVPYPRAVVRLSLGGRWADDLGGVLRDARAELLAWAAQRPAAPSPPHGTEASAGEDDQPGEHHGGMGHGGMGHGGMAMEAGGLALAQQAEDRDGLKLDVLHVPLGPVLVAWPAGLELGLVLQGDVVQDAGLADSPFAHAGGGGSWWDQPWRAAGAGQAVRVGDAERRRAAAHLDSAARLLTVSGADGDARAAARLRDGVLGGENGGALRDGAARLRRHVEGSRLLRRAMEGVGVLPAARAQAGGVTGPALRAAGLAVDLREGSPGYEGFEPVVGEGPADVFARLRQWLVEAELALPLADRAAPLRAAEGTRGQVDGGPGAASAALAGVIGELVRGQEFATVRLIVASLDPDGDDLAVAVEAAGEPVHA